MTFGTVSADVIQGSVSSMSPNSSVFRNRIINGSMVIDQRNAGASVTPTTDSTYTLDRFAIRLSQASKLSVQQNAGSITPPAGFSKYLGITSLSSYSVGASDYFGLVQIIEGYNIADLGWGTANAQPVTLSFLVYSSLIGTFGGTLYNAGNTRNYQFSYSIPVANTWTKVSITIVGDTSGTWSTNNSNGIVVWFGLGAGSTYTGGGASWGNTFYAQPTGSVSVVGTNGATFYITGVQLEVGSSATGFEYRQYQQELALCQRYFYATSAKPLGISLSVSNVYQIGTNLPVTMRTTPTLSATPTASFAVSAGSAGTPALNPNPTSGTTNPDWAAIYNSAGNWSAGNYVSFTGGLTAEL